MKFFRISNVLCLAVATLFGVMLFWTSQAVQQKEDDLADLKKSLSQEVETVRVLTVEWDYLNRPQRLEELARDQLGMELPSAKEVITAIGQIPEPVIPAATEDGIVPSAHEKEVIVPKAQPAKAHAKTKAVHVNYDTAYPTQRVIPHKAETVSPPTAEKQSFEKLIETLDAESGAR